MKSKETGEPNLAWLRLDFVAWALIMAWCLHTGPEAAATCSDPRQYGASQSTQSRARTTETLSWWPMTRTHQDDNYVSAELGEWELLFTVAPLHSKRESVTTSAIDGKLQQKTNTSSILCP